MLFAVLAALAARGGRASKEELVTAVWGEREYHPLRHDNRLHLAVLKVRREIEDDPKLPARLLATPDGYSLGGRVRRRR
jgi:DNA-binding winged helix-turn-helix (wHTH) protein